jgi:hypothetical protein
MRSDEMVPNETISWQEALGVVEKLSWPDQARLILELLQRQAVEADDEPVDLLTLAGVGAGVWTKVDTEAYLHQERESWQD